jgi:hypothetical protein
VHTLDITGNTPPVEHEEDHDLAAAP